MLHICRPHFEHIQIVRGYCPTCNKRRYFVAAFQEWYGYLTTCLSCGDRWEDGEMMPRPFAPHWRKDNIAEAKRIYRRGPRAIDEARREGTYVP